MPSPLTPQYLPKPGPKKGTGKYGRPAFNQAQKIIAKFNGESNLAALLGITRYACYRWGWAPPEGMNGLIPAHRVEQITQLARIEGVILTAADWAPERIVYDDLNAIETEEIEPIDVPQPPIYRRGEK